MVVKSDSESSSEFEDALDELSFSSQNKFLQQKISSNNNNATLSINSNIKVENKHSCYNLNNSNLTDCFKNTASTSSEVIKKNNFVKYKYIYIYFFRLIQQNLRVQFQDMDV